MFVGRMVARHTYCLAEGGERHHQHAGHSSITQRVPSADALPVQEPRGASGVRGLRHGRIYGKPRARARAARLGALKRVDLGPAPGQAVVEDGGDAHAHVGPLRVGVARPVRCVRARAQERGPARGSRGPGGAGGGLRARAWLRARAAGTRGTGRRRARLDGRGGAMRGGREWGAGLLGRAAGGWASGRAIGWATAAARRDALAAAPRWFTGARRAAGLRPRRCSRGAAQRRPHACACLAGGRQ